MSLTVELTKMNDHWLSLTFPFSEEFVKRIKLISGRRWVPEKKSWIFPYTLACVEQFLMLFQDVSLEIEALLRKECPALSDIGLVEKEGADSVHLNVLPVWSTQEERKLYEALALRGFSSKTQKAYRGQVRRFLDYWLAQGIRYYKPSLIKQYTLCLLDSGHSHAHVNQMLSAINFIWRQCAAI